jgi:hypothetical protein
MCKGRTENPIQSATARSFRRPSSLLLTTPLAAHEHTNGQHAWAQASCADTRRGFRLQHSIGILREAQPATSDGAHRSGAWLVRRWFQRAQSGHMQHLKALPSNRLQQELSSVIACHKAWKTSCCKLRKGRLDGHRTVTAVHRRCSLLPHGNVLP